MLLHELPAATSREVLVVVEVVAMVVQLLWRHQLFFAPRSNLVRSCLPEIEVYFYAQTISYICIKCEVMPEIDTKDLWYKEVDRFLI